MERALITGQDGSYPAEFLLEKGYALEDPEHRLSRLNDVLTRVHLRAASDDEFSTLNAKPPRQIRNDMSTPMAGQ